MSLKFRGEVQAEEMKIGVVSIRLLFTAMRLNEITKEVNEGRKEKRSKN